MRRSQDYFARRIPSEGLRVPGAEDVTPGDAARCSLRRHNADVTRTPFVHVRHARAPATPRIPEYTCNLRFIHRVTVVATAVGRNHEESSLTRSRSFSRPIPKILEIRGTGNSINTQTRARRAVNKNENSGNGKSSETVNSYQFLNLIDGVIDVGARTNTRCIE